MVRAERGGEVARVHVNRLQKFEDDIIETDDALGGVFPDTRRLICAIVGSKVFGSTRKFKVKFSYVPGTRWVDELELPERVVKECDELHGERHT